MRSCIRVAFADGKISTVPFRDLPGIQESSIVGLDLSHPYVLRVHLSNGESRELPLDRTRAYCDAGYDVAIGEGVPEGPAPSRQACPLPTN